MLKHYVIEKALLCDSDELSHLFTEIVGNTTCIPEATRKEAIKAHTPLYMAQRATRNTDYLLVARHGGRIIGLTVAHTTTDAFAKHNNISDLIQLGLWSSWTAVTPHMRQHNVAEALLSELENYAIHAGMKKIEAAVAQTNDASKALCRKLGFFENGTVWGDIRFTKNIPTP
jgi:L-amino acid N-acyltransferase YncA